MGCMLTRPVPVSQLSRGKDTHNTPNSSRISGTLSQIAQENEDPASLDFMMITSNIRSICKIEGTNPIVCLDKNSFPIISSKLFLDADNPTEIYLPVVAASKHGNGRVICFGHIEIMSENNRNTGDTEIFLSSSFQWALHNANKPSKSVLIIGFSPELEQETKVFLQQFSLLAEAPEFNGEINLSQYCLVMAASNVKLEPNELEEYVQNGGVFIALFDPNEDNEQSSFNINQALIPLGLAFTYCSLLVGEPSSFRFPVPRKFADVKFLNFQYAIDSFLSYIKQPDIMDIEETKLDDLVTFLRFYLMVIDESYVSRIEPLLTETWDFLNKTGFKTDKGIAPHIIHGICMILLAQLLYKIPFERYSSFEQDFPGPTDNVILSSHKIKLEIGPFAWFSTGLWLPAGKIGTIKCTSPVPILHIQIGSHQDSLLSKAGPWKRYPLIIMSFAIDKTEFKIASPFGGIVYIVAEMIPETLNSIELELDGFSQYPRAVMGHPEIWKQTKDIDVPWAELESPTFIFTVPTSFLKEHEHEIDSYFEIFDKLVNEVMSYTSCNFIRPYRIVFDIELVNDEPGCSYPLVFSLDDLDKIFAIDQPAKPLFTLLSMLTNISVRENCFDESTEIVLSTVSACSAIKKVWTNCNPLIFLESDTPLLFNELWDIHINYDSTILPKTLAVFQDPEFQILDTPEDMWILFVREFCRIGKKNFTSVLQRARPIPLNISLSLQNLPEYKGPEK